MISLCGIRINFWNREDNEKEEMEEHEANDTKDNSLEKSDEKFKNNESKQKIKF